jgi:hypothetical protein
MKTRLWFLWILIWGLGGPGMAAPYSWNNGAGGLWSAGGNWTPAGPPGASDEADLGDFSASMSVDLANPLSTTVQAVVVANNLTSYFLFDSDNNQLPPFPEFLYLNWLTHNGSADLYISGLSISGNSVTNNNGYFAFIGTNVLSVTSVEINGGTMCVYGFYPSQMSATNWDIYTGGTLKTVGTIYGSINILGGTFAAGCSPGSVTVNGGVFFGPTGRATFELDQPNVVGGGSDWVTVNGALTLDGTLDVAALLNFGAGTYRLFDYTGALVDHGVRLGTVPAGYVARLDFGTTNQVNLEVLPAVPLDIQSVSGTAVLSWTNALYHLQTTTQLGATWQNIAGPSPVAWPMTNTARFFRLAHP